MTSQTDVVNAALTGLADAAKAYDDSVATLHAAQDFAGVPQTNSTFADLQAQLAAVNLQVQTLTANNAALAATNTTLSASNDQLSAANLALQGKITKAQAD